MLFAKNDLTSTVLRTARKLNCIDPDAARAAEVEVAKLNGEPTIDWLTANGYLTPAQAARVEQAHAEDHPADASKEAGKRLHRALKRSGAALDVLQTVLLRLDA